MRPAIRRRPFIAGLAALPFAGALPAHAAPARYRLDQQASQIVFTYRLQGAEMKGTMPVAAADLMLDFDRADRSQFDVTLDAAHADAGAFFATDAMRGASVLDTAHFPTIRFTSLRVHPEGAGASVEGRVTIRGVTRPLTMRADLYRQKGTEAGDRSALSVLLTGSLSRTDFGATGFPALVGDRIDLRVLARIHLDA